MLALMLLTRWRPKGWSDVGWRWKVWGGYSVSSRGEHEQKVMPKHHDNQSNSRWDFTLKTTSAIERNHCNSSWWDISEWSGLNSHLTDWAMPLLWRKGRFNQKGPRKCMCLKYVSLMKWMEAKDGRWSLNLMQEKSLKRHNVKTLKKDPFKAKQGVLNK